MPCPDSQYPHFKCDEGRHNGYFITALRSVFMGKSSKTEASCFFNANMMTESWTKEQIASRLSDIKVMLRGIDFRSLRPMRAILTGKDTKADREELSNLEKTAQSLRSEAANLAMLQLDVEEKELQ